MSTGRARIVAVLWVLGALVISACGDDDPADELDAATRDASTASCTDDEDCDDGRYCNGVERCDPGSSAADDEGCTPATAPCPADECDESADRCDGDCANPDRDGDGEDAVACGGSDCDDDDDDRFEGNAEVCDDVGHDEDCDARTFGTRDVDGDGVDSAACCNVDGSGAQVCGTDCDDGAIDVRPGANEVCNDIDDDCDMLVDERVRLTLWPDADGDGRGDDDPAAVPMMACAERDGWVLLRGDCDDDEPTRHAGASEVCNAIDDDCDTLVDDVNPGVVVCRSGQSVACVNACGAPGTSTCRADCLGYDTCVASEACNGCDDDANGAIDDGFECARGVSEPCTNACGVAGTRVCANDCTWAGACTASEACNYCDDDGNEGFLDERPLATADASGTLVCSGVGDTYGVARCDGIGSSPLQIYASLLDGSAVDTAGAFWFDRSWYVGWGRVRIELTVEARTTGSGWPLGGWSLVLARGGGGDVGDPASRGVPAGVQGISFDWYWSGFSVFSPYPSENDVLRYRRLGSGGGIRGGANDSDGEDVVGFEADLDADGSTWVAQRLIVDYQPDDPRTTTNEERVTVTANGGTRTYYADGESSTGDPANDMPVGSPLRIGLTAGTYSRTISGAPFGAPVEARVHLATFVPPSGPGSGTWTYYVPVTRDEICPGL
ncbi:putative metal-binding motif-containing protein [Sandaracinus amylolyticus]|uniref:putative metal-binding motif-containing protein n=1 Tax=Sandaracinus amylolyticus TaxID=927083 RepID=UPI001F40C199|nr:putative metal-binding motif-containing protein [Sandaracinus amylolyticus]UJR83251.1 Hypothetical protein I5071_53180 [Sandaracinus amylolyticus]